MSSPGRAAHLARIRGLYGMVDLGPGGVQPGQLARALLDGGARVLQLRMKGASASEMLAVLELLRPLAHAHDATLIVNDRLDVALAGGADGVHLGQDDLPLGVARRIAPDLVIGISTHNPAQAHAAAAGGADYLGFGPVFATASKERPDPVVGLDGLGALCASLGIPIVAIGGIHPDQAGAVARAGAAAAAIIAGVVKTADPASAARRVTDAFGGGATPL